MKRTTLLEKITHVLEELFYLVAIIVYKGYKYFGFVFTVVYFAVIIICGLYGYGFRITLIK